MEVCKLDARGDIACMSPNERQWYVYRKGPFRAFAIDSSRGCAISSDGAAECWYDLNPQVPLCRASDASCLNGGQPPADKFVQVSLQSRTACGVTEDGRIACWGEDSDGVAQAPSGSEFARVIVADRRACALRRDGTATCWGESPGERPGTMLQLDLTHSSTVCVLRESGALDCAGTYSSLARDPAARELAQFSMWDFSACGLTKDGRASCWSLQRDTLRRVPAPPGPFLSILNTNQFACGLRGDGEVECWGQFWGNGSGPERCLVHQTLLAVDDATARSRMSGGYTDERLSADAGLRSSALMTDGYALLGSAEHSAIDPYAATTDGGTIAVDTSLWLLDFTDEAPGEVFCSTDEAPGQLTRHADELLVEQLGLSLLGRCPGVEPVAGTLSTCSDSACASTNLTGTLRGQPLELAQRGRTTGSTRVSRYADGTILIVRQALDGRSAWALLILPPDASGQSEVLCIADIASMSGGILTFSGLSTLGRCQGGGDYSVTGCMR